MFVYTWQFSQWWPGWWPVLVFQMTSYWIIFELALNLYRGKPLLYYDQKERDSGWTDKFFAYTGPVIHGIAKGLALAAMLFSIVLIFQRHA